MLDWLLVDANAKAFLAVTAGMSAVVGALTFLFSVVKGRADRELQARLNAKAVWADYMELAFDNPEFSGGFEFDNSSDALKKEQYEWFVSRMLLACEEAITWAPQDRYWLQTMKLQIEYHRSYFCAGHFDQAILGYCEPLQEVFAEWRKSCALPKVSSNA
jgi:hypothetical protein